MDRLCKAMNTKNSIELRKLAISSITAAVVAAKEHIIPYFQQVLFILEGYFVNKVKDDVTLLRTEAIDTLAALVRSVGKEHFFPLAEETMRFCLKLIDGAHEREVRRAVYNLIGALAGIVNEAMATVFPKIMDRIMDSVIAMEEATPEFKEQPRMTGSSVYDLPTSSDESDIEDTDDESDDENIVGYNGNNEYEYITEKEEAILCLKECCGNCGVAFTPYMEKAFENVNKMIDHPQECIHIISISTLSTFVISLQKQKNENAVRAGMQIFLKKILRMCREDEGLSVVTHILETLYHIMSEIHEAAVPAVEFYDRLFSVIRDTLNSKLVCQFLDESEGSDEDDDNYEESETHEALIQAAGNLLSPFGLTMEAQRFATYFGRVHQFFLKKLSKCRKHEGSNRSYIYCAIAECFDPLSTSTSKYFDMFYPIFIAGLSDIDAKARQNASYGLGELVFHSEQKSYASFPVILQALSELISKETAPSALDNVFGAVGRLILTNYRLVPLQNVLPVFLANLPMREDFSENETAIRVFKELFIDAKEYFNNYVEQILNITLHVLIKKEYDDDHIQAEAVELMKNIRDAYFDKFQSVANETPEFNAFVQSILMM